MVTAGELLQETRIRKKLTLADVSLGTKIKPAFLSAIEKGEYHKLPSPSYAHGFVKNYAEFLGIPSRQVIAIFKREFDANMAIKVLPKGFTQEEKPVTFRRVKTRRAIVGIVVLVFLIFGYLFYQYRAAFFPPPLQIVSPQNNATLSQDVVVVGKTDPSATVTVNNEQVAVDDSGEFRKQLTLFSGKNTITVTAKNTFGKARTIQEVVIIKGN
jgi:cytoskeletal protein RodZ